MAKQDKKARAGKNRKAKQHIVVFQDENGTVIRTSFVADGGSAEAPEVTEKLFETAHHELRFTGWDHPLSPIAENVVMKPVYRSLPKSYLVMYFGEDGKIMGTESVLYGEDAAASYRPVKEQTPEYDYIFRGWDADLTKISSDQMAHPVFEARRRSYRVRFFHEQDRLLKEQMVPYGQAAVPPTDVRKEADPTYHYKFQGWQEDYSRITGNLDVHVTFSSIYNEYHIVFMEEEKKIEETYSHYGDPILYPPLWRKGYTLHWSEEPQTVSEEVTIVATYEFSNPVGAILKDGENLYEIINPSISRGSVRCLRYHSGKRNLRLPSQVKLGDYYYRIERIGREAFSSCGNLEELHLPTTVRTLEDYGLANCRKLKRVFLGNGLKQIGRFAFENCPGLSRIHLAGDSLKKVYIDSFARLNRQTSFLVERKWESYYRRILADAISKGLTLQSC